MTDQKIIAWLSFAVILTIWALVTATFGMQQTMRFFWPVLGIALVVRIELLQRKVRKLTRELDDARYVQEYTVDDGMPDELAG